MEDKDYEVVINATKSQIERFKDSILWADICRELDFWAKGLREEKEGLSDRIVKENLSTAAALTLYISVDERKAAIKYFKQILDVFLGILEERKDDARRDETD